MCGPSFPLKFGDGYSRKMVFTGNLERDFGEKGLSFNLMSHIDTVKVIVFTKCDNIDAKDLKDIVETKIQELLDKI